MADDDVMNSGTEPTAGTSTEPGYEAQDRYAEITIIAVFISAGVGALCGGCALLIGGPVILGEPNDAVFWHIGCSILAPVVAVVVVNVSIWFRQLALPALIIAAAIGCEQLHGGELYERLFVCGLALLGLITMSITEAIAVTGKLRNFWRSFMYHPQNWAEYFKIKTS